MDISLPPDLEQYVSLEVKSGKYQSPSEVVRDGLLLLKDREQRLAQLRKEIAIELEQAEKGDLEPLGMPEILAEARHRFGPNHQES